MLLPSRSRGWHGDTEVRAEDLTDHIVEGDPAFCRDVPDLVAHRLGHTDVEGVPRSVGRTSNEELLSRHARILARDFIKTVVDRSVSALTSTVRGMGEWARYSDAFSVDRGATGCWRFVYDGGAPDTCDGAVMWAGWYSARDGRSWRVWSCDDHLDGGGAWVERPDRHIGGVL